MPELTLTSLELAVLVQRMAGATPLFGPAELADLKTDAAQVESTEESLLERGLLALAPLEEELVVAGDVAPLLAAALAPQRLRILRLVDAEEERRYTFSCDEECSVCNYVDRTGMHVLFDFADTEAGWRDAFAWADAWPTSEAAPGAGEQPLAALVAEMQQMATLLVVAQPDAPATQAQSMVWLGSRGGLWLVDPASAQDAPAARPVTLRALQQAVIALVLAPTA